MCKDPMQHRSRLTLEHTHFLDFMRPGKAAGAGTWQVTTGNKYAQVRRSMLPPQPVARPRY